MQYAGFWLRFIAALIDNMLLSTVQSVLFFIALIPLFFSGALKSFQDGGSDPLADSAAVFIMIYFGIVFFLISLTFWPYFACFECSSMQATPGKLALGLIVVDENGNRINFWRATGRNFGKIVSSLILNIGFIMAGTTARRQALHDIMSGCLVLRKPTQGAEIVSE